jgi:polyphosphate glucokinase
LGDTEAEDLAAGSVRTKESLSWDEYGARLNRFLLELERLLTPDRIIIGGGISENFDRFQALLHLNAEVVPAALGNNAGLIGAALAAASAT